MFLPPLDVPPENPRNGLGNFKVLSDMLIMHKIEYTSLEERRKLANCSKLFRILLMTEECWKELFLNQYQSNWEFQGDWKSTFLYYAGICDKIIIPPFIKQYYSPVLHQQTLMQSMDISSFEPQFIPTDLRILEILETHMTPEIRHNLELYSEPCIIKKALDWSPSSCWNWETLLSTFGNTHFLIGNSTEQPKYLSLSLANYARYMNLQRDESPLYVFEKDLEKCPELLNGYKVPPYITQDYLEVLGSERPRFRWVIIGPMRSGASWHVDPAGTSAWNILIQGKKRWALYPPTKLPPGLKQSMSSLYWYVHVYPFLSALERPIEVLQQPGDTIIVPAGWWHCVLNLGELNIAVTQNWTSSVTVKDCVQDMQQTHPKLAEKFLERLRTEECKLCSDFTLDESHDVLRKLIVDLLKEKLNIDVDPESLRICASENFVFYCEKERLFIKSYRNEDSFERESLALQRVSSIEMDIFPRVLFLGNYRDKLFQISKQCLVDGDESVPLHMVYNGSFIDINTTVIQLAQVFRALHSLTPLQAPIRKGSFLDSVRGWRIGYQERHKKWKFLDQILLSQSPLIVDRFFGTDVPLSDGVLHGDATAGNILGIYFRNQTVQFLPTHLIDFGDAFHAQFDPLWDIACLFFTVMNSESELLSLFLQVYGSKWSAEQIRHRLMGYLILAPSKALIRECNHTLFKRDPTRIYSTWQILEQTLFHSFL